MYRVCLGASRGHRWILLVLLSLVTIVALGADPADARSRRKVRVKHTYTPPYAALVVDANTGKELHAANADARRHPASLTKIMTLYMLFEQIEAGKIKLDTQMPVSARAAAQAPTKLGLSPGDTLKVEDAIKAMVTKSANDAAVVIAEMVGGDEDTFAKMMTRKARALGMNNTTYVNASGLPANAQITTARDQVLLGRVIQERFPRFYRYFATASFTYHGRAMRNHNKLLGRVEGVDGIKTGYTNDSGFNLVTSIRRGKRFLVAVVLGGNSASSRDARMRTLIESNIKRASQVRTAPAIAERKPAADVPDTTEAIPKRPKVNDKPMPLQAVSDATAAVMPVPTPRPNTGTAEPIQPTKVKTVAYKSRSVRATSPAPIALTAPQVQPNVLAPTPLAAAPAIVPAGQPSAAAPVPGPVATKPAEPAPIRSAYAAATADEAPDLRATATVPTPAARTATRMRGEWMIQVGAFDRESEAKERLRAVQNAAKAVLAAAEPVTMHVAKAGKDIYRARFAGFDRDQAEAACKYLKRNDFVCLAVKN